MRLSHTLSCQPLGCGTNVIAPEDRSDDHTVARIAVVRNPGAPATGHYSIAITGRNSAQYYDPRLAATPRPAIA
jgi:hypothetical protein